MTFAVCFLLLLLAAHSPEPGKAVIPKTSRLYSDLSPHFRQFHKDLSEFSILSRKNINQRHSLFLVRAVAADTLLDDSSLKDFRQESFGLFVIEKSSERLYMTIDIFATKRWLDYEVILEEVGEARIDIRRRGETYGDGADKVSYFIDLEQKAVGGSVQHFGMDIYAAVEFKGALYFIGTGDRQTTTITKLRTPGQPDVLSGYEIIKAINGEKIELIRTVKTEGPRLILTGDTKQYLLNDEGWKTSLNPEAHLFHYNSGSGKTLGIFRINFWVPLYMVRENIVSLPMDHGLSQRFLVWNSTIEANSHGGESSSGIYELSSESPRFYPFPNPTYDLFREYRARRVSDGYTREQTTVRVKIGPSHLEGDNLWFGTSFYDDEGLTGIGGIGYFDLDKKAFEITYLKDIAEWSTSAIYVDHQQIWLGLVRHPEGISYGGGLARYDRTTRATKRYDIPGIVNVIRPFRKRLYLGTSEGICILTGDKITHARFYPDVRANYFLQITQQ